MTNVPVNEQFTHRVDDLDACWDAYVKAISTPGHPLYGELGTFPDDDVWMSHVFDLVLGVAWRDREPPEAGMTEPLDLKVVDDMTDDDELDMTEDEFDAAHAASEPVEVTGPPEVENYRVASCTNCNQVRVVSELTGLCPNCKP